MPSPTQARPDSCLLRPQEAAALLGVRVSTVARWAREERLAYTLTPGGHRRYRYGDVRQFTEFEGYAPTAPPVALKAQE